MCAAKPNIRKITVFLPTSYPPLGNLARSARDRVSELRQTPCGHGRSRARSLFRLEPSAAFGRPLRMSGSQRVRSRCGSDDTDVSSAVGFSLGHHDKRRQVGDCGSAWVLVAGPLIDRDESWPAFRVFAQLRGRFRSRGSRLRTTTRRWPSGGRNERALSGLRDIRNAVKWLSKVPIRSARIALLAREGSPFHARCRPRNEDFVSHPDSRAARSAGVILDQSGGSDLLTHGAEAQGE